MPAIHYSKYDQAGDPQYNYVKSFDSTTVQVARVVDFGVADSKGRAVGMRRFIAFEARTLHEVAPTGGCGLWPVGAPLQRFAGVAISTRNGVPFGSAEVRVFGSTETEVAAELDARIEKARRLAVKKHSVESLAI
jgi:hypothetical protein